MALRTACSSCGKKLQVRDELAGKKVKCPDCGTVFIASAGESATAVKSAPSRTNPAAASKDKLSSKPMVKKPAPPPMDDDDEVEERPVRSRRAADDDDDDDDGRPSKSKGKKGKKAGGGGSRMALWLALGGVLLIGGGVAAYLLFFNEPTRPIVQNNPKPPVVPPDTNSQVTPATPGSISLADLVPGDSLVFLTVSAEAWHAKSLEGIRGPFGPMVEAEFQKIAGFPLGDLDRLSLFTVISYAELKKNPTNPPMVIVAQTKKPVNQQAITKAFQTGELGRNKMMALEFVGDQTVLVAAPQMLQVYKTKKGGAKATGVLERALTIAGTSKGIVMATVAPPEAAQDAEMALKDLPPAFAPFAPFAKARSVLLQLELTDRLLLNASLIMDDATAAMEAKTAGDGLVALAGILISQMAKDPEMAPLVKLGQQALKDLKFEVKDKEMTIAFQVNVNDLMMVGMPLIEKMKGAGGSAIEINNYKQIVLAWHNYHDVSRSFPPQTVGKGLSWRVAILPYLEQDNLYKMFKLDEPWDSPTNIKLLSLMPQVYATPGGQAPPGQTYCQTFVGPNTVNKTSVKGMPITAITDGSSNTIVLAESARPVPWTKPDDITVAADKPVMLGGSNPQTTLVAFADGSVRRISRKLDQKTLRLLIDPTDGTPIPNLDASAPPVQLESQPPNPPAFLLPQKQKAQPPGAPKIPG